MLKIEKWHFIILRYYLLDIFDSILSGKEKNDLVLVESAGK